MSLVIAVWDEFGGIAVSESRMSLRLPAGGFVPFRDDVPKISRIREDLIFGGTGECYVFEIMRRSIEEKATSGATFADLETIIIPRLVTECCRNYPGAPFSVLLLGNDAGKVRGAGWASAMPNPEQAAAGRRGSLVFGFPPTDKEAHDLVTRWMQERGDRRLDLQDAMGNCAAIISSLAATHNEINDQIRFETLSLPDVSRSNLVNAGAGQMWANLDRSGSGIIPKIISNKTSYAVLTSGPQNVIKSNTTAQSVAYVVKADCNGGVFSGGTPIMTAGVVGRCLDANNLYLAQIDGSSNVVTLFKIVAGAVTSLGTFTHTGPSATLSLQITDAAKVVLVNGVSKISSADNALTSAGSPGFWLSQSAATVITSPTVDNFSATYIQNVASPPTPPAPPNPPGPIVYDPGSGNGSGTGGGREIGKL